NMAWGFFIESINKLPLFDRNPVEVLFPDIKSAWADKTIVFRLLYIVAGPSGNAAHSKNAGEQIRLYAHRIIDGSREEIHIRIDPDFVFHGFQDSLRPFVQGFMTGFLGKLFRHTAQDTCSGVHGFINPMANARN